MSVSGDTGALCSNSGSAVGLGRPVVGLCPEELSAENNIQIKQSYTNYVIIKIGNDESLSWGKIVWIYL